MFKMTSFNLNKLIISSPVIIPRINVSAGYHLILFSCAQVFSLLVISEMIRLLRFPIFVAMQFAFIFFLIGLYF